MGGRHRVKGVLQVQNWVRSFKLVDTGLGGAGEMESKFVGEVCMRKFRQDLARRDAERQRRRGRRRAGCWGENRFDWFIESGEGLM